MKKQAVVNQIKRESEVLEDRLLDKVLAQVPSIVRRELTKIQSSEDSIDRAAKDRREMQRQLDTFNAFYKVEIRKIDEHLSERMDQLTRDHTENLKKILESGRSKTTQDAIEAAKLYINNRMQAYKKDLLQLQFSWLPNEIQKQIQELLDIHENNCLVGKCSVDRADQAGLATVPNKADPQELIMAVLSHTPPTGPTIGAEYLETYSPHGIAKRAHVSNTMIYKLLKDLFNTGKIQRGEFLFGTQYRVAYWVDDAVEPNERVVLAVKKPLTAIKPATVLGALPGEVDQKLTVLPKEDPHTIYGIVKTLGFDDDREKDATKKVRTILYGLINGGLALKKTIALTYSNGDNRADWAFWRAEKTRPSA